VVVGDVNSTLACALATAKVQFPDGSRPLLAHVEAGLRSGDRSMPEEVNRVLTDAISDVLFTTEEAAAANLIRENVAASRIHFVGNVMIDCLVDAWPVIEERRAWEALGFAPNTYGLVTLHRPSNVDDPEVLSEIVSALADIARRLPLIFPVHPRTRDRLHAAGMKDRPRIHLIDPLGYLEFVSLMSAARVVLTDTGGLQEESTFLHVPCLTLRDNTERPATISYGTNTLVGRRPADLARTTFDTLARRDPAKPAPPLWDGHASDRIAQVLRAVILPQFEAVSVVG
jgi:UDP-N-acetylglucosamine 2-epimerase (non-hydrolysing)